MVVLQHPAQPLPTLDRGAGLGNRLLREDQLVVQSLVIALAMIMSDELLNRPAQRLLPKQDHALQAGFLDRPDKALGVGIQVV